MKQSILIKEKFVEIDKTVRAIQLLEEQGDGWVPMKLQSGKKIEVSHVWNFVVVGPNPNSIYNNSYCLTLAEADYKFNQLMKQYKEFIPKEMKA
jgi:hypothetical protein